MAEQGRGQAAARWVRRLVRPAVLVPAAIPVLVLAGFWSLVGRISTHTLGDHHQLGADLRAHLWQYWWVNRTLEQGELTFVTQNLTFPAKLDMLSMWGGHLDLVAGIPLVGWLGVVGASNVVIMLFMAICGLCVYALALEVSGSRLGAFVGAMLYVLSPIMIGEAYEGRVEELCFGFIALFVLYAGRWLREGRGRHLALTLVSVAVALFAYYGTGLLSAAFIPPLALGYLAWTPTASVVLPTSGRSPRRSLWQRIGILAGALALMALPVLVQMFYRLGAQWLGDAPAADAAQRTDAVRDWLGLSHMCRSNLSQLFTPLPQRHTAGAGLVLPVAALLALIAPKAERRRLYPWLLSALVLSLLCLGPYLFALPGNLTIPSPYVLLPKVLPFFTRFHYPYRFMLLGALCFAIMAAVGVSRVGSFLARRSGIPFVAVLFPLMVFTAGAVQAVGRFPVRVRTVGYPAYDHWQQLKAEGAKGVVLLSDGSTDAAAFRSQMDHEIPFCCIEAPASLMPKELRELQRTNLLFQYLTHRSHPDLMANLGYVSWGSTGHKRLLAEDPSVLSRLGYTHVVVSLSAGSASGDQAGATVLRDILRHHFGPPFIEDNPGGGVFVAYRIRPPVEASPQGD